MIESDYYFQGIQRWNLLFPNPNQGALFWSAFMVVIWMAIQACLQLRNRALKIPLCVVLAVLELVLTYLLFRTYSRGAFVAIVLGSAFFFIGFAIWRYRVERRIPWVDLSGMGIRWGIWGMLSIYTGFWGRIQQGVQMVDGSSSNRLSLWKGGLEMFSVSPWNGWGWGKSGEIFMHWFQDMDEELGYRTLVNTWLTILVEGGALYFCVILFLPLCLLVIAIQGVRSSEKRAFACVWVRVGLGSAWVLYGSALFFSSFLDRASYHLPHWILLTILALVVLTCRFAGRRELLRGACFSVAVLMVTLGAAYWVGWRQQPDWYGMRLQDREWIQFEVKGGRDETESSSKVILLLPDEEVLGVYWGKEVRRLLSQLKHGDSLWVRSRLGAQDQSVSEYEVNPTHVFLLGQAWQNAYTAGDDTENPQYWFIHPVGFPPDSNDVLPNLRLILPEITQRRDQREWRIWAEEYSVPFIVSLGVGIDIRWVWPEVLVQYL